MSVGKQQSLCALQNSSHSPSTQRRMSKQWSMPSVTGAESPAVGLSVHTSKDSRTTTLSKSSSCRSAGPTVKRHAGNFAEITIDVADADDEVTMASQLTRRSVVRNSSVNSEGRQLLDVYYDSQTRWCHVCPTRVAAAAVSCDRPSFDALFKLKILKKFNAKCIRIICSPCCNIFSHLL